MSLNTPLIHLACLIEATARKAGNVHPGARFEHVAYEDFVRSAEAVAPILAEADPDNVGSTILEAVESTRRVCEHNTNLGIILLLAPLAAVPVKESIKNGLRFVLRDLGERDSHLVYEAIQAANPRGLGTVEEGDVNEPPPALPLVALMRLAKNRDSIAAQYANGFHLVLNVGLPVLMTYRNFNARWETATIHTQLALMARQPDTDIARKCGREESKESARRAQAVLDAGWPTTPESQQLFTEFDQWLRANGSLRNPGTTADLVTACIFVALRDRLVTEPKLADLRRFADEVRAGQGKPLGWDANPVR